MIILDPGHGGKDPGVVDGDVKESEEVLKVAKITKSLLEYKQKEVFLTRSEDDFVSLKERSRIPNSDDIFVSIHYNGFQDENAQGVEAFHYPGSKGGKIATDIVNNLLEVTDRNFRRVEGNKNFYVVRETRCPAVLIELGFLTNPDERKIVTSQDYQLKAAMAIAEGVINYD